jgi:hypothetical protein
MVARVRAVPDELALRLGAWTERCGALRRELRADDDSDAPDLARDALIDALGALRTALRRVRYAVVDAADARERLGPLLGAAAAVPDAAAAVVALACDVDANLPARTAVRREFYVYLHRAPDGAVFYVGKGRGRRAWSRARTEVWRRHVDGALAGRYDVEIHRDGLTSAEALALEAELVARHGARLVNWINPARDIDAEALERARLLRAETLGRVGTAAFIEGAAPAEALRRYALALADVRVYCRIAYERGLLGDLKDVDRVGEPIVLDRLTRCLERLGRGDAILRAAADYFAEFPDARGTPAGERVGRRCERAAAGRLQAARTPAAAQPRRRRVLG